VLEPQHCLDDTFESMDVMLHDDQGCVFVLQAEQVRSQRIHDFSGETSKRFVEKNDFPLRQHCGHCQSCETLFANREVGSACVPKRYELWERSEDAFDGIARTVADDIRRGSNVLLHGQSSERRSALG